MTPLLAAWSSARDALRSNVPASSVLPASAASRNLRIEVLSDDFTALLRNRARSLVRMRLICDLMFATRKPSSLRGLTRRGYQRRTAPNGAGVEAWTGASARSCADPELLHHRAYRPRQV